MTTFALICYAIAFVAFFFQAAQKRTGTFLDRFEFLGLGLMFWVLPALVTLVRLKTGW